jgi:hypothetical protein
MFPTLRLMKLIQIPRLLQPNSGYSLVRDLRVEVKMTDDMWNGFKNSEYSYTYFQGADAIARTTFRAAVGQIGWIYTKNGYQHLREDILFDIVSKMLDQKTPPKTVWEALVVSEKYNSLYKKWGFTWQDPVHHTVTGDGWTCAIEKLVKTVNDAKGKTNIKGRGSWS